jgi:hypothetical protein
VKITDQRVLNKKPAAVGIGFGSTRVGQEWIFIKRGDGIVDKRDPNSFFRNASPVYEKAGSGER